MFCNVREAIVYFLYNKEADNIGDDDNKIDTAKDNSNKNEDDVFILPFYNTFF